MKKNAILLTLLCFFIVNPALVQAEEDSSADQSLVQETNQLKIEDLTFNTQTRVLSGKTNPHTNIYLNNLAEYFSADENGQFSVTVPETISETKLIFLDALTNQSLDFDYSFKKGAKKEEETTTTPASTTQTSQQDPMTSEKKRATINSEVPIKKGTTKQPHKKQAFTELFYPLLLIGLGLSCLLVSGVFYWRTQKRKKQARLARQKKRYLHQKKQHAKRPLPKKTGAKKAPPGRKAPSAPGLHQKTLQKPPRRPKKPRK